MHVGKISPLAEGVSTDASSETPFVADVAVEVREASSIEAIHSSVPEVLKGPELCLGLIDPIPQARALCDSLCSQS